jgi:hypothetical protein
MHPHPADVAALAAADHVRAARELLSPVPQMMSEKASARTVRAMQFQLWYLDSLVDFLEGKKAG